MTCMLVWLLIFWEGFVLNLQEAHLTVLSYSLENNTMISHDPLTTACDQFLLMLANVIEFGPVRVRESIQTFCHK